MGVSDEGRFMVAVGAVIENSNGEMLLLKRAGNLDYDPGGWDLVTGRMKQGESPNDALLRETEEETGLREIDIIKPIRVVSFFRGDSLPENEVILIVFWCRAKNSDVRISSEHSSYRWIDPKEALDLIEHEGIKKDIEAFIQERSNDQR